MALLHAVADLLFPPACQVCGQPGEFPLCAGCRRKFLLVVPPVCQKCGRPLRGPPDLVFTCTSCRHRHLRFSRARAPGVYEGALREAIHALKFGRCRPIAGPLGRFMATAVRVERWPVDIIVPVPLHATRLRERGFNQCDLLAREIGADVGSPVVGGLLVRTRATEAQSGLNRERRHANVLDAFAMRDTLSGERVLLVDDVMSTGCTASECARVLRRDGAGDVYTVAAAMALVDR